MLTEELHVSTSVTTSLTPARQDRDWRLRWDQLLLRQRRVSDPRSGGRGSDDIHSAAQDLLEFFVSAYHLKDALIADKAVNQAAVEQAISDSPTLSLLADLANLDKHRVLGHSRSGETPVVKRIFDVADDDGWRVRVLLEHKGREIDGSEFATTVIAEWRTHMVRWGLIP